MQRCWSEVRKEVGTEHAGYRVFRKFDGVCPVLLRLLDLTILEDLLP